VQSYRNFVSQSSEFCRHNPLRYFSTSVHCCKSIFRYLLSPETFGYSLVYLEISLFLYGFSNGNLCAELVQPMNATCPVWVAFISFSRWCGAKTTSSKAYLHIMFSVPLLFISDFFSSPPRSDRESFPGWSVELTTRLHLLPRLRMGGATPPLPDTFSWHGA